MDKLYLLNILNNMMDGHIIDVKGEKTTMKIVENQTMQVLLGLSELIRKDETRTPSAQAIDELVWKPIETAPKDGSRILACQWTHEVRYGIVSISGNEWELVDESGKGLGRGFYPTHWINLPLPPLPTAPNPDKEV